MSSSTSIPVAVLKATNLEHTTQLSSFVKLEYRLTINETASYEELQQAIGNQCSIPISEQRLILKARAVDQKKTIEQLNMQVTSLSVSVQLSPDLHSRR